MIAHLAPDVRAVQQGCVITAPLLCTPLRQDIVTDPAEAASFRSRGAGCYTGSRCVCPRPYRRSQEPRLGVTGGLRRPTAGDAPLPAPLPPLWWFFGGVRTPFEPTRCPWAYPLGHNRRSSRPRNRFVAHGWEGSDHSTLPEAVGQRENAITLRRPFSASSDNTGFEPSPLTIPAAHFRIASRIHGPAIRCHRGVNSSSLDYA